MKTVLGILLCALCAAGAGWRLHTLQQAKAAEAQAGKKAAPVAVVTAVAQRTAVPVEIRTFGAVEALSTVTVKAQVSGLLSEVLFTEGQEVRRGDVLARIDARPFEAELHQQEAALASAQAQVANAERTFCRMTNLFARGFASENDRDQAATALNVQRAAERASLAAVERSRIELGYCTLRAPVSGRTGRRLADCGNLAAANATALVTIHELQPARVAFAVPQQELARLREWERAPEMRVEATPSEPGSAPEVGRLVFLDNAVDRATGTLTLKAEFANADKRLWPGQFVDVSLRLAVEPDALVIPYRAVQNGQKGTYVFVVKPDRTVEARPVKVARNVDERSVIAEGLAPGETVVTDGQQRLGPGSQVAP